ncbi:hypothetical protein SBA1_550136 [Candidatus Sulfotelmatobacter kueseliae]|uniref:Uncharacterized protein n=1 Tax=Candidatus Sulfotelmatobacter kueseliae TaxID=2042962 RepID=A0A2U3KYN4_9BACT|nr:hypothetical protein SBA1_550136 [Candidatus Sulfotelmatobacter kueseliae]
MLVVGDVTERGQFRKCAGSTQTTGEENLRAALLPTSDLPLNCIRTPGTWLGARLVRCGTAADE